MLKTRLSNGNFNWPQRAIIGFWVFNFALILLLWLTTTQYSGGLAIMLDAIGMLFGLLATFFALTQFMLMGRVKWIERRFGLDHLASYHRLNGYLVITFILIHPIFITISYSMENHINIFSQFADLVLHNNYIWLALIAEILFIAVVASSIYISRKHLKFETWYFVHLAAYAAIVIVPLHQLAVGDSFIGGQHPLARGYWIGLYAFVGLNIAIWRFGRPLFNLWRFNFRVEKIIPETDTTVSVYIRARRLERWRARPGQFVLVRIFTKQLWWQEHPFSLSMIPDDKRFRLTIRNVGDYTAAIAKLKPGARVLVSGPYGRFTSELALTSKRLFIAGGVGITPIRSLAEQAVISGQDSVLIYGNKAPDDVPLKKELNKLAERYLELHYAYSDVKVAEAEQGYVNGLLVKRLVPDYKKCDIYLCGPPPMMEGIVNDLNRLGFPEAQLHYERFALHSR